MRHIPAFVTVEPVAVLLDMTPAYQGAVCQSCRKPLLEAWKSSGQLCFECGLDYELFHPETRWIDESDQGEP